MVDTVSGLRSLRVPRRVGTLPKPETEHAPIPNPAAAGTIAVSMVHVPRLFCATRHLAPFMETIQGGRTFHLAIKHAEMDLKYDEGIVLTPSLVLVAVNALALGQLRRARRATSSNALFMVISRNGHLSWNAQARAATARECERETARTLPRCMVGTTACH